MTLHVVFVGIKYHYDKRGETFLCHKLPFMLPFCHQMLTYFNIYILLVQLGMTRTKHGFITLFYLIIQCSTSNT